MNMKLSLSLKNFFLPLGGCLAAALVLNNCMQTLPDCLFYPFEHSNPGLIQWVKVWGRLLFSSIATILLILVSLKVEVQKVIRWFFIGAIGLSCLYVFYLIPEAMSALAEKEPLPGEPLSSLIMQNWILVSFFLLVSYWPSTIILFIYSFANRYLNITETYFTYPVFAILGIVIPIAFIPSKHASAPTPSLESIEQTGYLAILLTFFCFLCFEWISRKNPKVEEEEPETSSHSPDRKMLFIQGTFVLATAFLYQLNKSVWFSKGAIEYPAPQEYTHFLTSFDGLRSLGMLLDVVFLLFLLMALEKKAGRGWKNVSLTIVIVSVSVGLCLILYNVLINDHFSQILLKDDSTLQSFFEGAAIGSGYQIFFTAVSYPILLCLKEMTFQIYAPKKRFTAKLYVDLVFAKAGLLLATAASFIGSSLPLSFRLFLFTAVLLLVGIIWLYFVHRIGNKIEEMSPEPA